MRRRTHGCALTFVLLLAFSGACYEAPLDYFTNITALTSACFPRGVRMESSPMEGIVWPEARGRAMYGLLPIGDGTHPLMMDQYDGQNDLYVDAELTDELRQYGWDRVLVDGSFLVSIPFRIRYTDGETSAYQAFLIWSPFAPATVTCCRDSYRAGSVGLADGFYRLAVLDTDSDGRYDDLSEGTLILDADGNGEWLITPDSHEIFFLDEPFNLNGIVYQVSAMAQDGSWIDIVESNADVEPKPPLLAGFPAPVFEGVDAAGEAFSLELLRGDILVVDFWASWCGPCIYELPTLSRIGEELGAQGVRVIGVNLDRSEDAFRSAVETYAVGYLQIYDSDVGTIGDLYRIQGIPMTYVIDRDGIIYARGLRGENLIAAVQELLENEE